MRSRLHYLKNALVVTVTISKAHKLIGIQTEDLMSVGGAFATKGLKHIQYLNNYWMMGAL